MDKRRRSADALPVALGAAIRAARERTTQSELAALVGVDQGTVSKWENGKQRPSLEEIEAIELKLGRPRGWVLVHAGLVDEVRTVEEAIAMDARLDDTGRRAVLGALQGVLS